MVARASNINSMQYRVDDKWSSHIPALLIALFPVSSNEFRSVGERERGSAGVKYANRISSSAE